MGVPKFFRWMSERYPAISQLIAENRIPEFDCLYLDMNGIIHNCTHKDSDSPTFRMTEDAMFIAIFNYIEHLFATIKPQQLFFMAIDGVAPRAKMNQQRSRRFRTALDNERARDKAIEEGLEMPKEDPFDSNCITPGTGFMARLTQQLKYFINKKISEDRDWQGVEIVLSGHEVPGEGEHKIMEYIRKAKSQPNYDPNVRHCLYGLDADLIMLGLLSHDPHFCLLREEVTFGRANQKKSKELEHQNFYLMHLCVVREYLELEFQELKEPGVLPFAFDMERVIDDFILMAFFVGNDFLPNLPHLHINEGALALMFETYKKVLPTADGFINEGGTINIRRLGLLLDKLSEVEYRHFESDNADASWLRSKQSQDTAEVQQDRKKGRLVMSTKQREIFKGIKNWVNKDETTSRQQPHDLPSTLPAADREFVKTMAEDLHVQWNSVVDSNGERHLQLSLPPKPEAEPGNEDDEHDEEAQAAIFRVLKRYENAKTVDVSPEEAREKVNQLYQQKFRNWKDQYYKTKFEWGLDDEEDLRKLTENYVQGLQWVLYYYYRGVASWPWYFQYHYSPMISDITKGFNANLNFELGKPFRPFQQLMGVLPDRSKTIVPEVYHELMTSPDSPIIDFYPRDFDLDMNGKKMEWEAVVKIPFIDEKRLLAAMKPKDELLTEDERKRNEFGVSLKFTYSADTNFVYPSSLPGIFNNIQNCHCIENIFELPTMDGLDVYVGLVPGAKLGVEALANFPSLKHLPFNAGLDFHGVSVFQQDSRNASMILTIRDDEVENKVKDMKSKIGTVVQVGYPFLQEARITKVSDELFDYILPEHDGAQIIPLPHNQPAITEWQKKAQRIESTYSKRLGIVIGTVEMMAHVELLQGVEKTDDGATVKVYGDVPGIETEYAAQTVVDHAISQDQRFIEKAALPLEQEFPLHTHAFFLGGVAYGRPLEVLKYVDGKLSVGVGLPAKPQEESWARKIVKTAESTIPYTPSFAVAKMLKLNSLALSKITSAFNITSGKDRLNIGLNLKFESKKQKVLGYSRKSDHGWEFSQKAIDLIVQYMVNFPDFIAGLQRNPQASTYEDTDFYPEDTAAAKMTEIKNWLKSIESKSFERVPLDAEQLDSDVVQQLEQAADRINSTAGPLKYKPVNNVPRHALLKPADAQHRLGSQKFEVGDRTLYISDTGKVPLGLTGTVVGITRQVRKAYLDVVLDTAFMGGSSLGDRCSPFRGATIESNTVLNLTNKQLLIETAASAARQPAPAAQSVYVNGYGAPTGPGGRGQLFDAQAPPPLRGSFSSAAAPSSNRGRGGNSQNLPIHGGPPNGSPNRGRGGYTPRGPAVQNGAPRGGRGGSTNSRGFTLVDNSDPTEGVMRNNPDFRMRSYANVPPPATLSNGAPPQRGRGGGGYRGPSRGPRGGGSYRGRGGGAGARGTSTAAATATNSQGS